MAFDYGSIDLGIKNPFKKEGAVTTLRGLLVVGMGIYLLMTAAESVKENPVEGWVFVVFGLMLGGFGMTALAKGIIAMLRYFVGRNHPTSLAFNESHSQSVSADEESSFVAYDKDNLKEMLVGRKNMTFVEPQGLLARLLHTIFPRMTYMPYQVRNLSQAIFGSWVKTCVAVMAYAFAAFVTLMGFTGETGEFIFPVYSVAVVLYLLHVWFKHSFIKRIVDRKVSSMGHSELLKIIAGAILLPVLLSITMSYGLTASGLTLEQMKQYQSYLPPAYTSFYLIGIFVLAAISTFIVSILIRKRLNYTEPKVEVSELRENWQESVHPNEIFINLDNLVMANRRYKEVPNRVYQQLNPNLNEQVESKGNFLGEMIQEIQPKYKEMELGAQFNWARLVSLLSGNALYLIAAGLVLALAYSVVDLSHFIQSVGVNNVFNIAEEQVLQLSGHASVVIHTVLVTFLILAFARLLSNSAHCFFAEMLFESNLIYLKVEGTFSESKISTGAAIHDSTRSENTLVRSSITPWVIVSRLVTSIYAASGMQNLEHPRYILEMHGNDAELNGIRADIINFLKDRESIASITSERDLRNASQIHEINKQSRAELQVKHEGVEKLSDEAAGYLRKEEQLEGDNS